MGWLRGTPRPASPSPAESGACFAPAGTESTSSEVRFVSQEQARALSTKSGVAFVDCRPRSEFEAGHVAGAVHFEPRVTLPTQLLEPLRAATTVITYCDADRQCARSLEIARQLGEAGLPDVRVLEGGLPAWLEHGFPAESGTCQQCEATK